MNIAKNMEAIFVVVLGLASISSFAGAAVPAHRTAAPSLAQVGSNAPMQVVTITAKRLTAAEKAALAD